MYVDMWQNNDNISQSLFWYNSDHKFHFFLQTNAIHNLGKHIIILQPHPPQQVWHEKYPSLLKDHIRANQSVIYCKFLIYKWV